MRLSSLSIAAILLFSSIVLAQHHEPGTAPSAPPPSPASGPAPSAPAAAPAPSPTASIANGAPNAAVSHASAPSVPPPTSVPVAPGSGSTGTHGTISPPTESRSFPTATSPAHEPRSDPGRLTPDQRVPAESKIVSAPRIGQYSPGKEPEMKPGPPGLRHRICGNEPCKEKGTEWKADPPRTDLRRRVCVTGPCPCAPGQPAGKGGCIANPPVAEPVAQPVEPCQPGENWNGAVCMPSNHCAPGEIWNGTSCIASTNECASIDGRAAILVSELRALKAQIQDVCGQKPPGQDCEDLKQRQGEALQRYQMLLSEAGPGCQATPADLASLE
jgi:hypothetical protein